MVGLLSMGPTLSSSVQTGFFSNNKNSGCELIVTHEFKPCSISNRARCSQGYLKQKSKYNIFIFFNCLSNLMEGVLKTGLPCLVLVYFFVRERTKRGFGVNRVCWQYTILHFIIQQCIALFYITLHTLYILQNKQKQTCL